MWDFTSIVLLFLQACSSQGICYVPLYDTLGKVFMLVSTNTHWERHVKPGICYIPLWMHKGSRKKHISKKNNSLSYHGCLKSPRWQRTTSMKKHILKTIITCISPWIDVWISINVFLCTSRCSIDWTSCNSMQDQMQLSSSWTMLKSP